MIVLYKVISLLPTWPILLALLLSQRVDGQNLVPNPSFEDVNTCAEFSQPCSPSAWFFLSRKLTTGYFPRYVSATGSRHLQLVAASRETANRQYWETMLLCPLQAGERYAVSMKIASPANKTQLSSVRPNLRDIGLWFTSRFIFVQGDSILQPAGFLSLTSAGTRDLKNGWFEIRKEFTATTNAPILMVGNFIRVANADIMDQRNWPGATIDVLVDDISVVPLKGVICPGAQTVKDSLYAILRRHSDHRPGDSGTDDPADTLSGPGSGGGRSTVLPSDSLRRPVDDPLFGPEPRRVIDTGDKSRRPIDTSRRQLIDTAHMSRRPPPRSTTDTLIIHNIQFDFDKYLVQNPDTLQRYRSLLTRPGIKKIKVVGYTDDIGSEAYNKDLSGKRAREVGRLLSSKFAIPARIIEVEGRGISRSYPTKELNRRVEIYIFHE